MCTSILAPVSERFKYGTLSPAEIQAALEDYDAMRFSLDNGYYDDLDLDLPDTIGAQIESRIKSAKRKVADEYPDYEIYTKFFDDCFSRLNAQYPCPSITSDFDKAVIFDAIQKGDTE